MNLDHIIEREDILGITAYIIGTYVAHHKISVQELCDTMGHVYDVIHSLSQNAKALTYKEFLPEKDIAYAA